MVSELQYEKLILEEKGKLLNLMNKKFIKTNFSKLTSIAENNLADKEGREPFLREKY